MPQFGFTATEHDPDQPWIVRSRDHCTVTLDDGVQFFQWAAEQFPAPRWTVELDPFQPGPEFSR